MLASSLDPYLRTARRIAREYQNNSDAIVHVGPTAAVGRSYVMYIVVALPNGTTKRVLVDCGLVEKVSLSKAQNAARKLMDALRSTFVDVTLHTSALDLINTSRSQLSFSPETRLLQSCYRDTPGPDQCDLAL